jgi:hypothetical protein
MYVETFEIDVIVFIGNVIMCLTSHWPIISGIQSQFINYDNITPVKNLQITNNIIYQGYNHFSSYLVKLKLLQCDVKHIMTLPIKTITSISNVSTYIITVGPIKITAILVIMSISTLITAVILHIYQYSIKCQFL